MSDKSEELTSLPRVGPRRAELLSEAGYDSAADVRRSEPGELTDVHGIGDTVARLLSNETPVPDGGNWSDPPSTSRFEDVRDALIRHAAKPKTIAGVARDAGVGRKTLYDYLDRHEDFAEEFRQARGVAETRLIERGLEDDPDVDTNFVRFLLERSYDYTKEERHKIESENTHHIEGDGFDIVFADEDT